MGGLHLPRSDVVIASTDHVESLRRGGRRVYECEIILNLKIIIFESDYVEP